MFLSVRGEVRAPTFLGSVSVALTLRSIALATYVGGGGPNSRQDTGDDSDSFHGKLDVAVVAAWVGAALEVAPWCWTQSTVFLPTLFGIGLDASLRRRLLELGDLAL